MFSRILKHVSFVFKIAFLRTVFSMSFCMHTFLHTCLYEEKIKHLNKGFWIWILTEEIVKKCNYKCIQKGTKMTCNYFCGMYGILWKGLSAEPNTLYFFLFSQRIVWVRLTFLWSWCLKVFIFIKIFTIFSKIAKNEAIALSCKNWRKYCQIFFEQIKVIVDVLFWRFQESYQFQHYHPQGSSVNHALNGRCRGPVQ